MRQDDEACRLYAQYVSASIVLPSILSAIAGEESSAAEILCPEPKCPGVSLPRGYFSNAYQGAASYLSSGWPVAYLAATAITVLGLVLSSHIYISRPTEVAGTLPVDGQSITGQSSHAPTPAVVASITGMADCVWSVASEDKLPSPTCGRGAGGEGGLNKTSAIHSAIRLGDRLSISSGLLEITYDTGAKVILQGPVTYEVESTAGGYLSIGKLTARLEKDNKSLPSPDSGRMARLEKGNKGLPSPACGRGAEGGLNQSDALHSAAPLFAVRTPTTVVTDLGTEFGVDVGDYGTTTTHVFRGSVEVRVPASATTGEASHVLHKNESALVRRETSRSNKCVLLTGPAVEMTKFVREIRKDLSSVAERFELVAYWTFDGNKFLFDSSGHGHSLVNQGAKQVADTAFVDGKSLLSTVDSIDLSPYQKLRISWSSKGRHLEANQILWEQSDNYNSSNGAIIASIEAGEGLTGIRNSQRYSNQRDMHGFETETHHLETFPVGNDVWEHFVVEFDRTSPKRSNIVRVFKDGILVGQGTNCFGPAPRSFANAVFHIGARKGISYGFTGQIDNLKIEGESK